MAAKHIHKYYQVEMGSTKVWACALSYCHHYMPYHMRNMVKGKSSICWNCGEKMILNSENMKFDRPFCDDCRGIEDTKVPLTDALKKYLELKENKETK